MPPLGQCDVAKSSLLPIDQTVTQQDSRGTECIQLGSGKGMAGRPENPGSLPAINPPICSTPATDLNIVYPGIQSPAFRNTQDTRRSDWGLIYDTYTARTHSTTTFGNMRDTRGSDWHLIYNTYDAGFNNTQDTTYGAGTHSTTAFNNMQDTRKGSDWSLIYNVYGAGNGPWSGNSFGTNSNNTIGITDTEGNGIHLIAPVAYDMQSATKANWDPSVNPFLGITAMDE
jgi:hypothetical protein